MTWQDRIREAAYTPAGGQRATFDFVDVSRSQELRGTAFEFPDADGTFVQRLGTSGRQYPMRIFISGADYDLAATAFEAALAAPGIGVLEHPIYGELNVVPFGRVDRNDRLATEANQAVIQVTFWDTIETTYPTTNVDGVGLVSQAVETFNAAAAEELAGTAELNNAVAVAQFESRFQGVLDGARGALSFVASASEDVQKQFNAVYTSINQGLDVLVEDPLTLGFQTAIFLEAPARSVALITDKLTAYNNLADSLIGAQFDTANDFYTADLYASTTVAGVATSVLNNDFETRGQALAAAEFILTLTENITNWRDEAYAELGAVDTGGQYQAMLELAAITAGYLVELSFSLAQERSLVLLRDRTIIDLVAELYGSVDDRLDFFIDTNALAWDETLEIKAGRRIVYYA